jgi:hypothetical protein
LRGDGHRLVDLAADIAGAVFIVSFDAAEEMVRAMGSTVPAAATSHQS